MSDEVKTKVCSKCKVEKLVGEFYKQKATKDGFGSYCKICNAEITRKWQQANPEKMRKAVKKWQKSNPEKAKESARKYREANPERVNEAYLKWQKANSEKEAERHRKKAIIRYYVNSEYNLFLKHLEQEEKEQHQ